MTPLRIQGPMLISAATPRGDGSLYHVLGVLERLMPRHFPIHMLFAFEADDSAALLPASAMAFPALRASLSRVLDDYPQLAGRVQLEERGGAATSIVHNNAGAVWLEADVAAHHPPLRLASLVPSRSERRRETAGGFSLEGLPAQLLATAHTSMAAHGHAVLLVQATRLSCGSVTLDVAVDHAAFDGRSFFAFVRDWAELHRAMADPKAAAVLRTSDADGGAGEGRAQRPCEWDEDALAERIAAWKAQQAKDRDAAIDHSDDFRILSSAEMSAASRGPLSPTRCSYHHFSASTLCALKAALTEGIRRLRADNGALPPLPPYLSTQDALLSHLWSVLSEARQLRQGTDPSAVHRLRLNVACHTRMEPPLPDGFTGPAAVLCPVAVPAAIACADEARSLAHFVHRAARIRRRVLDVGRAEYLCSLLHRLSAEEPSRVAESIDCVGGPDVMTTSWTAFAAYDCDFGAGRPSFLFKVAPESARNCLTVLPSPDGEGALELCVVLSAADHERLVRLARMYDFRYH